MRLLPRFIVILMICFLAMAPPPAPARADSYHPFIDLDPYHGMPGTRVELTGGNFTAGAEVSIWYYHATGDKELIDTTPVNEDGDLWLTFLVPESCTGDHEINAYIDTSRQAMAEFTVEPGLTVSPEEGTVGTRVAVKGHGFAEEEVSIELMYYLRDPADYKEEDTEEIVVADNIKADKRGRWQRNLDIPSSYQGVHTLYADGSKSHYYLVEDTTFEVIPAISLYKSSGTVGESVAINGTGFDRDDRLIQILFAGDPTETEPEHIYAGENGNWTASFKVPQKPTGTYSVTAEGEDTSKEDITAWDFTIAPGLLLSPDKGHVGTNVTVTGAGFTPDKAVVMKYDEADLEPPATTTTDVDGSFRVSFLVPKSKHGAHNVTARDDEGNNAIAIFTMESDPPGKPELFSPYDGDRLGFIGNVRVTFNWSEVEDLSGVRYNLQIATSANVTDTGFADPVREILVVGTNYTLDKTEALPFGTYYWIVQAVDGADNKGAWTEARAFRTGVMPLWAFVVIIVVVAGGIGAFVYFRVIRQRIYYY